MGREEDATDLVQSQSDLFSQAHLEQTDQLEALCEIGFSAHAISAAETGGVPAVAGGGARDRAAGSKDAVERQRNPSEPSQSSAP
ncbi:hypothetical protein [Bradyrhizobium sp. ARR65]|uniref:hypothetical protein n=1 Tax=Bradyrhizobium sp. ARR65 TaxID=1040989 RepID=UPI0012F7B186|nr:hypothetical protein [Bradyrhizobium sp. ARR65]